MTNTLNAGEDAAGNFANRPVPITGWLCKAEFRTENFANRPVPVT